MSKYHFDLLCVGVTSWDQTFLVDHHPGPDEKMVAESFHSCGGGPAANAAVAAANLGLRVGFIGYLGNDIYGKMHLDELHEARVVTDYIIRGERPTPISTVLIKPGGERMLVNFRANRDYLKPSHIHSENLDFKAVLFDGHEPEIADHILKSKKNQNFVSVLDAGSLHDGTRLLYKKVDYLVASSKFAEEITGSTEPYKAIDALATLNPNAVITLGKDGVIWNISGAKGNLSALPVNAVDTTGAGDIFHGVFTGCLALGKNWLTSLKYANSAAALSCTEMGGRTSIPIKSEIEKLVRKYYPE